MCDQETRELFRGQKRREWTNTIMLACLLSVAGWMALQTYSQGIAQAKEEKTRENLEHLVSEHIEDFTRLIKIIPDGFFSKSRYGMIDAESDRKFNALARGDLDRRLQVMERLTTSSSVESNIYFQITKENAKAIQEMQKILWKLMPDE